MQTVAIPSFNGEKDKYLYRFSIGKEILAETFGLYNARKIYASFTPQLRLGISLAVYLKVEFSESGNAGLHLEEITKRVEELSKDKPA